MALLRVMKHFLRSLHVFVWLLMAWSPVAQGQTQIIVPGVFSNTIANTADVAPLGSKNQHIQQVYAGSLLAASGLGLGDQITAIGFRLADGEPSLAAQTVSDYSIWMGLAVVSPGNLSMTFAANGSGMTQVRSGELTIADGQFSGGNSLNPFGMIQLSVPYTYLGGNLLIEISCGDFSNGVNVDTAYPFDSSLAQTAFGTGSSAATADQGLFNEAIVMAFTVHSVPEPTTLAVVVCGMFGFFLVARRHY